MAKTDRGDDGERRSHPEQTVVAVNARRARTREKARCVAGQDGDHRLRAHYTPSSSASAAEQKTFGEQHAAQRTFACAERRTDSQLSLHGEPSGENQVGDVGARDDEEPDPTLRAAPTARSERQR